VTWLKDALELVGEDKRALGRCVIAWDTVRKTAMDHCNQKKVAGRFSPAEYDSEKGTNV
jgi:hypothetical protein